MQSFETFIEKLLVALEKFQYSVPAENEALIFFHRLKFAPARARQLLADGLDTCRLKCSLGQVVFLRVTETAFQFRIDDSVRPLASENFEFDFEFCNIPENTTLPMSVRKLFWIRGRFTKVICEEIKAPPAESQVCQLRLESLDCYATTELPTAFAEERNRHAATTLCHAPSENSQGKDRAASLPTLSSQARFLRTLLLANAPITWIQTTDFFQVLQDFEQLEAAYVYWSPTEMFSSLQQSVIADTASVVSTKKLPTFQDAAAVFFATTEPCVLILGLFSKDLLQSVLVSQLLTQYRRLAATTRSILVISPAEVPEMLSAYTQSFAYPMPTAADLLCDLQSARQHTVFGFDQVYDALIVETLRSLTREQFRLALRELAVLPAGTIRAQLLEKAAAFKFKSLRQTECLVHETLSPENSFRYLKGLDRLKKFVRSTSMHPQSRGVLLLGIPGCGKTSIARALGYETNRPVFRLSFAKVYNSLLGSSETRIREVLRTIDLLAPCVLLIDEIEKSLAGAASSARADAGAAIRVLDTFLQWLDAPHPGVYVIGTCNRITEIPPEFLRSERWDSTFFVDFPSPAAKQEIWSLWKTHFGIMDENLVDDTGWSGADIRTCCRLAMIQNSSLRQAAEYVVPIAKSAGTKLVDFREFAMANAVVADTSLLDQEFQELFESADAFSENFAQMFRAASSSGSK